MAFPLASRAVRVSGRTRAFTLIELLAVIAIIAVLAGILVPVLGSVRKSARQAVSMSNLRSLTMALVAFAADNRWQRIPSDNGNPRGPTWDRQILPYLGYVFPVGVDPAEDARVVGGSAGILDLFRCPFDTRDADPASAFFPRSYGATGAAVYPSEGYACGIPDRTPGNVGLGIRLAHIRDPSRFVVLCRSHREWELPNNVVGVKDYLATYGPPTGDAGHEDWQIYGGKTPYGFIDGHVKLVGFDEAAALDIRGWRYGM
jgi:prepilin-type N-terminal cleavage/methylation domain